MPVAVLLCARCGSHRVDVNCWRSSRTAVLRCYACDHEAPLDGFTVGRVYRADEASLVTAAIQDAALPSTLPAAVR